MDGQEERAIRSFLSGIGRRGRGLWLFFFGYHSGRLLLSLLFFFDRFFGGSDGLEQVSHWRSEQHSITHHLNVLHAYLD